MSAVLEALSHHAPDAPALVGDADTYNYGEMQNEIAKRAEALTAVSVLAIALDNGPEWILWDLACIKAQIPCVPIPPFFTNEQVFHSLQTAGVTHLLSPQGLRDTGIFPNQNLPQGTAKITYTSGTTGEPKGVCLSQRGMEQTAASLVDVLGAQLADKHLSILPLAVLLENIAGVYATLMAGGTVYVPSLRNIGFANPFQPDFTTLARSMRKHAITSAIMVPELLRGLMSAHTALPDLKFLAVGGSKISPQLITAARNLGLPVYEGYGLSECASVVSLNTPGHDRPGSVGRVLTHIRISEHKGEIIIENPAFLGYVGQPHAGHFTTGDLGRIDTEGFLSLHGRRKNVLITSYGRNISPEWIESLLLTGPEIAQAVVYGDAQPFLSALVVPASPQARVQDAVQRTNTALPAYAQIKDFRIVPPFTTAQHTLTGTGRPRRENILNLYAKENSHDVLQHAG